MVNYDTLMHSLPNATYFIPESYSYRNDRAGLPTIIFTVWQATVTNENLDKTGDSCQRAHAEYSRYIRECLGLLGSTRI